MLALGIKFGLIGVKPRIYPGPLVVIAWLSWTIVIPPLQSAGNILHDGAIASCWTPKSLGEAPGHFGYPVGINIPASRCASGYITFLIQVCDNSGHWRRLKIHSHWDECDIKSRCTVTTLNASSVLHQFPNVGKCQEHWWVMCAVWEKCPAQWSAGATWDRVKSGTTETQSKKNTSLLPTPLQPPKWRDRKHLKNPNHAGIAIWSPTSRNFILPPKKWRLGFSHAGPVHTPGS